MRQGALLSGPRATTAARLVVALLVALPGTTATLPHALGAQDFPVSSALPPESRQFDFWVGTWDVTLRIRQDDGSWPDAVRSTAHVYPVLSGKAILELWSDERTEGIKGYSLRYFDTAREEWVLWLNWPGPNRSGSSSLAGGFRHGRGEFFSTTAGPDGSETISRYTFSDVTPTSLRWDDAFSSDGGETWTNRWIMEFTRTGAKPTLDPAGGPAPTFHDGTRCDDDAFRRYDFLSGRNDGEVVGGGSGAVTITGYRVLDGCAVMTFAGPGSDPERAWGFSFLTFNTYAQRYELTTITSQAATPARVFYSRGPDDLVLYERRPEGAPADAPVDRMRIERSDDGSFLWAHEAPDGDGWRFVWAGRVRPG